LGVAGESGSGKSTLVYGLTRLLRAPGVISSGDVRFNFPSADGIETFDILEASEESLRDVRWSHVSIVLQSALSALNPLRRIGKEFDEVLRTHDKSMDKATRAARAAELLDMVGLDADRLDRFPHELSGGQRQRVMIAMALALQPELVIMDEPTTALDVVTQREIVSELYELRQKLGFAMIFITHDLSLLVELADEIMVMYAGTIIERAVATDLYNAPRHPYTLGLMNSFPPLHGERTVLTGIPGSPPDLKSLPTGCTFSPRCPYAMDICRSEVPPLGTLDDTGRLVACWLHDPSTQASVPVELSKKNGTSKGGAA
jgi:peptide/nickel transport system ATP-binding protein